MPQVAYDAHVVHLLAIEADALARVNLAIAGASAFASDADMVEVLVGWLREVMQSSPAACAAVTCVSTCGVLEPQASECVYQGLCIAVPILLRLASARAPLQTVKEVLELWLQEADPASRVNQPPGAMLGLAMHTDVPAEGSGAGHGGSTSDARLALGREVFSADVRASMHGAACGARHVVFKALATAVALLRSSKSWLKDAMPTPNALGVAAPEAAAASTQLDGAGATMAAARASLAWASAAVAAAQAEATKASEVAEIVTAARKEAVVAEEAALSAVRGGAAAPPLAGAAATGGGNANMEQARWQAASAAGGGDEAEDPEQVPDAVSEGAGKVAEPDAEHIIHEVADDLAALEDGYMGPDLTIGRNTCACGLPATLLV